MDEWYYARDGQQLGPVSIEALSQLIAVGTVAPQDLVWREGMAQWTPASSLPELYQPSPDAGPTSAAPAAVIASELNYYAPPVYLNMYAGFWLRVAASLIDGVLLAVVGYMVTALFAYVALALMQRPNQQPNFPAAVTVGLISYLLKIMMYWLYGALMESSAQQGTIGKMAVGICVTDVRGTRLTFARATGRHFAKYLSLMTFGVGYVMAGFTQHKQALHDMIAGCLVIRRPMR